MYGLASINSNPPAPGLKNILYINKQRATDCIKAEKHRACSVIFINHARFSYMTRDFLCPSLPSPPRTAPPRPLFKQTRITARCINVVKVQPRNKLERAVNTGIFLFFMFFFFFFRNASNRGNKIYTGQIDTPLLPFKSQRTGTILHLFEKWGNSTILCNNEELSELSAGSCYKMHVQLKIFFENRRFRSRRETC